MKIKCLRLECPLCKKVGLAQIFYNKQESIRYARIRHFSHTDAVTHKPQFTYCKVDDLGFLKDLLKTQGINLTTEKVSSGQLGQMQSKEIFDLKNHGDASVQGNSCGCRLVWFRTLAFQANDPGFKSRRPHHIPISIIRF